MIYAIYNNKVQSQYDAASMQFDTLFYDLDEVDADIRTWTGKANALGSNIQATLEKINVVKNQMPTLENRSEYIKANLHKMALVPLDHIKDDKTKNILLTVMSMIKQNLQTEIVLIYQNRARRYYLCELIYQCTAQAIDRLQEDAIKRFPPISNNFAKSMRSIGWLKKQLPKKVDETYLKSKDYIHLFVSMETDCNSLLQKINLERQKLNLQEVN